MPAYESEKRLPSKPYRKRLPGEDKKEYDRKKKICDRLKFYYKFTKRGKELQKSQNVKRASKMEVLEAFAKSKGFIYNLQMGELVTIKEHEQAMLEQAKQLRNLP